jgi:hypothetical protein
MRSSLAGVRVLASPFTSAGFPGVWSAREIGSNGEHGREQMVNRNYATPIGGGSMRPVNLFQRRPISKADEEGIVGMGQVVLKTPGAPIFLEPANGEGPYYLTEGFAGTPIYAAAGIGSRIMPGWNVRQITPAGETGPLKTIPRRFARPINNGALRPYKSLFGRRIGPRGAEGPVIPLGGVWQELLDMPLAQKVAVGACLAVMVYLAAAKIPEPEER